MFGSIIEYVEHVFFPKINWETCSKFNFLIDKIIFFVLDFFLDKVWTYIIDF